MIMSFGTRKHKPKKKEKLFIFVLFSLRKYLSLSFSNTFTIPIFPQMVEVGSKEGTHARNKS